MPTTMRRLGTLADMFADNFKTFASEADARVIQAGPFS